MDLFLDREPEFLKEAAFAARVTEQPENWPQELTSELLKQLPFLSDYDLNVNLDRVDPGRGFAFGYADVANKTERPEAEHEETGIPHIRIPIILMDRSVKPFSIFLDGERVLPLTEDRIRSSLFNPTTFDLSSHQPRDPSLIEATMPPQRSGMGMGGEYKQASVKEANGDMLQYFQDHPEKLEAKRARDTAKEKGKEKKSSLLLAIAPTMSERDVSAFTEKLASDPFLIAGFRRNGMAPVLIEALENTKRASADDRLDVLSDSIAPTAVTIQKLPGGDFLVKSANVNAFAMNKEAKGKVVKKQEAEKAVGPNQAAQMQPGQTATAVADPVASTAPAPKQSKVADEFGQYKVQDQVGNYLLGHVIPQTLAWDGNFTPQPMALFSNGSAYAVQDTIAGEMVGKGVNLPEDSPRGDGCFYTVRSGDVVATQPVTIGSVSAGPDGMPQLQGTDAFGNPLTIRQAEGLKDPMRVSDSEYAIPDDWKFMRLNNQTQLVADPSQMSKSAEARSLQGSAELFFNGGFHLEGGCGLEKLSVDFRYDMDHVTAEFMLGVLGVNGAEAKMKVAEARKKGCVKLANLKSITLLSERYGEAEKTASKLVTFLPNLRRDLTKEAASLEDEGTVDNLLALNFINPENLATFVNYIPDFETCSEHLAEMLLFSYLGMNELPEGAIERAMKNLEDVLVGLNGIAVSGAV